MRVGGGDGQTWAWAWRVGRMGRAGTAQGEPPQQHWRNPPHPIAAAFWSAAAGLPRVGSRHSSHGGRNLAIAEIAIHWSF